MDEIEVRLRIIESLIPVAARNDIRSTDVVLEKARALEEFVIPKPKTKPQVKKAAPKRVNQSNKS